MAKTSIGWCDQSVNFYTWSCKKISEGCVNCYAEAMAKRAGKTFFGLPQWREAALKDYQSLKPGESAFVNDMSDTFIDGIPFEWVERIFMLMRQRSQVQFLVLSKRIERALELAPRLVWSPNIWIGTSIENQKRLQRLDVLKQIPTENRFVSVEPLLEGLGEVSWVGVRGVIVGGESGEHHRPFHYDWARAIRDQCRRDGTAFFFKQASARYPGQARMLDGRTHDDVPWRREVQPPPHQESMF